MNPKIVRAIKLSDDSPYNSSESLAVSIEKLFYRFDACSMISRPRSARTKRPRTHGMLRRFFAGCASCISRKFSITALDNVAL